MLEDDSPRGTRFSHVYLDRGAPTEDNKRMRRRIAALIDDFEDLRELGVNIPSELGIDVPYNDAGYLWDEFLEKCSLSDVLNLVTVAYQALLKARKSGAREFNAEARWVIEVNRIFAEENVHYHSDDRGGVHFRVDNEFARNRAATIAVLQAPRYANALHSFDGGLAALTRAPPDGKSAIRGVFFAVEGIFRLIVPKAPRLGADELNALQPVLQRRYAQDETALRSSTKMLSSLKDWVDAAHFYAMNKAPSRLRNPR